MVTNIFCLTQIDQQILITIEKQDILALQKRDTLPWELQPLCALCLRYVKDVSIYHFDLQRINYSAKHKTAFLKMRQNKQDMTL
jgi:hypothetical protein